jgi:hypothetical protein
VDDAHTPRDVAGNRSAVGGERADLEEFVVRSFEGMYAEVASLAADGADVVVDVGHHDSYSQPLGTWGLAHWLLCS